MIYCIMNENENESVCNNMYMFQFQVALTPTLTCSYPLWAPMQWMTSTVVQKLLLQEEPP